MPATLVQVVSDLFFLWWKKHVITHPRQSQWSLTAKMICSWYGKWSSIARTCGLWWSLWMRRSWTGILSWIHFYFEQKNLCTPKPYSQAYDCFAALLWSTFTNLPSVTQVLLRNASEHLNVVNRLIASFRRGWRMASFRHGKRKRTEIKNDRYLATMERFRNHPKQNHQLIPLVTCGRTFRWNSLRSVGQCEHILLIYSTPNSLFQTTRPNSHDASVKQNGRADVCPWWPSSSQLHYFTDKHI